MSDTIIPRTRVRLEEAWNHELKILTAYPEYEDIVKYELDALLKELRSVRGALLEDVNQHFATGLPSNAKLKERDLRKVARERDDLEILAFIKWHQEAWNEMTGDPASAKLLGDKRLRNVVAHGERTGPRARREAIEAAIHVPRDVYLRVLDGKTGEFVRKIKKESRKPAPQPSEPPANADPYISLEDREKILGLCHRMTRYVDQAETELRRYKSRE